MNGGALLVIIVGMAGALIAYWVSQRLLARLDRRWDHSEADLVAPPEPQDQL